jgi:hypothetical protein
LHGALVDAQLLSEVDVADTLTGLTCAFCACEAVEGTRAAATRALIAHAFLSMKSSRCSFPPSHRASPQWKNVKTYDYIFSRPSNSAPMFETFSRNLFARMVAISKYVFTFGPFFFSSPTVTVDCGQKVMPVTPRSAA